MLVCWVFDLVLGGGNPDLQGLWVPPVMVAMAVLWWFVVGFVWWVCGWWVCGGCWLLGEVAIGCWVRWLLGFVIPVVVVVSGCGSVAPTVLWERETEKRDRGERKNKKLLKNNKETIFKWNGKKNKNFDIGCMVKWCVICYKYRFWEGKC